MRASGICLLIAATTAWADPKPPTAAQQAEYKTQLAKGRKLQGAKKYPDAIAAFTAALVAEPDDAVALAELGWTAYLAKDLKTAEAMTRKSLAHQPEPHVRGASLYNLGLIQEANGDKPGAIASYKASLGARPNGVVRKRLATLDAAAAAAADPFATAPLSGPYASIDAFCKTVPQTDDVEAHCACGEPAGDLQKTDKLAIQPFSSQCTDNGMGSKSYALAVQVGKVWFVEDLGEVELQRRCDESRTFQPATTRGGMTLVAYHATGFCRMDGFEDEWSQDWVTAIGLGASKLPSASRITLAQHATTQNITTDDPPAPTVTVDYVFAPTWSDGAVELASKKTTGLDRDAASNLQGKHPLVFK